MKAFQRISTTDLIVEMLRRLQEKQLGNVLGLPVEVALSALTKGSRRQVVSSTELVCVLNGLIQHGHIIITGRVIHFKNKDVTKEGKAGFVSKLHLEAKLHQFQWFTLCGTALSGSSGMNEYRMLCLEKIFVTEDSVPKEISNLLKQKSIDCY